MDAPLGTAVSEPILRDGAMLHVGVSIGMATGAGCAHGDDLLSRADGSMFETKRGRSAGTRSNTTSSADAERMSAVRPRAGRSS